MRYLDLAHTRMHDQREHDEDEENRDDEKGDRPPAVDGHRVGGAGLVERARRVERAQQVGHAVAKHLSARERENERAERERERETEREQRETERDRESRERVCV